MKILFLLAITASLNASDLPDFRQKDKQIHFVVGAVTSASVYHLTRDTDHPRLYGFAAAVALGAAKEIRDKHVGYRWDPKDVIATALGGSVSVTFRW